MARFMEIRLERRDVACVARLLDDAAPRTCEAVWNALPLSGDAYHAKYARNEIFNLVPAFADPEPGRENPTITPIPGDVVYFSFEPWQLLTGSHGYDQNEELRGMEQIVDLALFYERNNGRRRGVAHPDPADGRDRRASFEGLGGAAYGPGKRARTITTARHTGLIASAR